MEEATFRKPDIDRAAYHGPAGLCVEVLDPHTEADPVGVLVHILIMFGSAAGREPHQMIDGARHGLNLFGAFVGNTSIGRKGTAEARARQLLKRADPEWEQGCIQSGIVSGEGIIHCVRDPIEREEPVRDDDRPTGEFRTVLVDEGVADKRVTFIETEFSSLLKVGQRQNNLATEVLRQAWDSRQLRIAAKNKGEKCDEPHISVVGHITPEELKRNLTSTEQANGVCNRYFWLYVKRSKKLADPTDPSESEMECLALAMRRALCTARRFSRLKYDDDARAYWKDIYENELSDPPPGMVGEMTARGPAQVKRLAAVYACMDSTDIISVVHLRAALAVWNYSVESVKSIFGDSVGDPDADSILAALRSKPNGLTRSEISALFQNNLSAARLSAALQVLLKNGLADFKQEKNEKGGRPPERWFARKR